MKFTVHFKTPDAANDAIDQLTEDGYSEDNIEAAKEVLEKFLRWGECVLIEFDTHTQTAKVV